MTLADVVELTDLFYIGGTKVGALCGEALVFTKHNMPRHFLTSVKQHGALLAKMRVVSQQFDALFTDGLYFQISRHAIDTAMRIKRACLDKGYELLMDSPTNQQFPILSSGWRTAGWPSAWPPAGPQGMRTWRPSSPCCEALPALSQVHIPFEMSRTEKVRDIFI